MADDIQQLPTLGAAPLLHVTAADTDSRSSGDGYLRNQPGKKQNKKSQTQKTPAPENQTEAVNATVLLHDEVTLTRSARTVMGEKQPPPTAPPEPHPEEAETPPNQSPAPPQHICFTA